MTPHIHHHDTLVSTNDTLLGHAQAGAPSGTVVVADRQTGGRGRQGRAWLTLPGEHVFMSLLWRPPIDRGPAEHTGITLDVGLALCRVLASLGVDARLKWPNDVLVASAASVWRKVGGILCELHDDGHGAFVVIGVGLDVNTRALPPELADIATSVELVLGHAVDRRALVTHLVAELRAACDAYVTRGGPDVAAYVARCVTIDQRVRVDGRVGTATGIASDGALLVVWDGPRLEASTPAAPERVVAGEVEQLGPAARN